MSAPATEYRAYMDNPYKTDPNDPRDVHLARVTDEVRELMAASRSVGEAIHTQITGGFEGALVREQAAFERLTFSIVNALRNRKDG